MLRQILGDDTFGGVESVDFWNLSRVTDADLGHLARLPRLQHLQLDNSQVTDAGLVHLAGLKGLKYLNVSKTQVTDAGVAELQESLPNCRIRR